MPTESPQKQTIKHVACTRCRERKVKCDGVKPNCARCRRIRHPCQYLVSGKKQPPQAKSEWIRHLRTFSAQIGDQGHLPYASAPQPLQSAANNGHAAAFTPAATSLRVDNAVNVQRTTWDSQRVPVQAKVAHSASHFLPSPTVVFQDGLVHPETPCSPYFDGAFPCPTSHMYADQPTPASAFFLPTLDRSETPTSQASCETWSDQFFDSYLPVIDTSFDMSIAVDPFEGGRHSAGSFYDSNFATY